ncbi:MULTISPECIES: hypothetical protein [Sphingobacterium]|uniref:Uncharacterized protein n=1 Tax=Sphingobacterium multivorum TaxID=28454 RepID=A0A654CNG4_SPHMU|nr:MULTISPECIES: hypothetical protein [Sphingobacterium]SUJ87830.1 Uncharacterised protein [Sphingobacterium multivorum]VXC94336.1 conserved hypothetical protein [Sphingobacterium multivorum]HBI87740.1 hypothetical protein [Sphingobacterium sp.]
MWSLILYFLFGIGQPSNSQPGAGTSTVQTADAPPVDPGDNGGKRARQFHLGHQNHNKYTNGR